ncbi:hypothetical protein [Paenibacillus sp. GCM10027626]|uniref:hypothetical protein n=1 Tax=Paenibacillus sp. GCM10027626 TaxID=3273411 RepID=UPI00362AFFD9
MDAQSPWRSSWSVRVGFGIFLNQQACGDPPAHRPTVQSFRITSGLRQAITFAVTDIHRHGA